MKNLLEEGFDVTGFDKNAYVGGLWHYNEGATLSVLKSVSANIADLRDKNNNLADAF